MRARCPAEVCQNTPRCLQHHFYDEADASHDQSGDADDPWQMRCLLPLRAGTPSILSSNRQSLAFHKLATASMSRSIMFITSTVINGVDEHPEARPEPDAG